VFVVGDGRHDPWAGVAEGAVSVAEQTIIQRCTPDSVRSRVNSAGRGGCDGARFIAVVPRPHGFVINLLGVRGAYLMAAFGCVLAAAILVPVRCEAARATVVSDEGLIEEPVAALSARARVPVGLHLDRAGNYSHGLRDHCPHRVDNPERGAAVSTLTGGGQMTDYAVINPATGEQVKTFPTITDEELAAVPSSWRTRPISGGPHDQRGGARRAGAPRRRAARRAARGAGRDHVREMGKPIEQALGEIDFCRRHLRLLRRQRPRLMKDEPIKLLAGEGSAIIRRSSLGVILGIMPWNFPTYQVARFAGPNLIIGNTVLLKHAPQCPRSAAAMQSDLSTAGFPEGAYVNIYATNEQIAEGDRRSARAGRVRDRLGAGRCRRVAEIAGRNLKKVVLELGGSDPFILLSTDDLDDRRVGGRRPARQHRAVVQRGQAVRRGRRAVRAVPGEVHRRHDGVEAGRPDSATTRDRPAVVDARGRPAAGPARTGRSKGGRRSSPAGSATATSSRRRC
jgi:hypothetical protein